MTAVFAMLLDAYRELNSKRLFWVTLFISATVVVSYASMGFNPDGMTIFFGLIDIESPIINENSPWAKLLYRSIFSSFIVSLWLAWVATILALISTTTIFPDFMAGGSIDLVLSKPLGRIKLFVIKYCFSLLFVLLQVAVFCVGIFFCMGLRIGEWNWLIFAAIPLVTVFFSYLYSVNVLFATITRSALTSLLLTLLLWFSLFSVSQTEGILNLFKTQQTIQVERLEEQVANTEASLARMDDVETAETLRGNLEVRLEEQRDELAQIQATADRLDRWHRPIRASQRVLPKTAETIGLLDRWLKKEGDLNLLDLMNGNVRTDEDGNIVVREGSLENQSQQRMVEEYESRSSWYVIGTSLAFEFVVLSIACLIFCRRDY